jgi:hypothetical protein
LRRSHSVASAAIRIKPTRPSVMAASSSANAVPRRMSIRSSRRDGKHARQPSVACTAKLL